MLLKIVMALTTSIILTLTTCSLISPGMKKELQALLHAVGAQNVGDERERIITHLSKHSWPVHLLNFPGGSRDTSTPPPPPTHNHSMYKSVSYQAVIVTYLLVVVL